MPKNIIQRAGNALKVGAVAGLAAIIAGCAYLPAKYEPSSIDAIAKEPKQYAGKELIIEGNPVGIKFDSFNDNYTITLSDENGNLLDAKRGFIPHLETDYRGTDYGLDMIAKEISDNDKNNITVSGEYNAKESIFYMHFIQIDGELIPIMK